MVKTKNISDVKSGPIKERLDQDVGGTSIGEIEVISTKELMALTGATMRQIDYWCTKDVISPLKDNNPGTGNPRQFNKDLVDKVRLIVKISKAFSRLNSPLKRVIENYDYGFIELGDGITLSWDWVEHERGV